MRGSWEDAKEGPGSWEVAAFAEFEGARGRDSDRDAVDRSLILDSRFDVGIRESEGAAGGRAW